MDRRTRASGGERREQSLERIQPSPPGLAEIAALDGLGDRAIGCIGQVGAAARAVLGDLARDR